MLKPELPGGEAGWDPGVLGAIPPHPTALSGVGDVTSVRSNSNSQPLSYPFIVEGIHFLGERKGC